MMLLDGDLKRMIRTLLLEGTLIKKGFEGKLIGKRLEGNVDWKGIGRIRTLLLKGDWKGR